jgi:hypothetical protein
MNRFKEFKEIINHKIAFLAVRKKNNFLKNNISLYRALMHDSIKAVNVLLLGDDLATKIHRKFAGHHSNNMNFKQKVEAFCDWECARFTKSSKPLNGKDTWLKYYSHIDMEDIVKRY